MVKVKTQENKLIQVKFNTVKLFLRKISQAVINLFSGETCLRNVTFSFQRFKWNFVMT